MARSNKRKMQQAEAKRVASEAPEETRRAFLRKLRNRAVGAGVLAGAGWLGFGHYEAMAAEYDLTRIGEGKPKVVQIHDPGCPLCARLQREARAAVEDLERDDVCFLIANIRTDKGRAFAARHGVSHITLVLLDGEGAVIEILEGDRQRDELQRRFEELFQTT